MVGKTGFEPATPWSQTKCSTKLSHFPMARPKGFEPITFWSVVKRSIQLSYERNFLLAIFLKWWLRLELNQRHKDFQSSALPTELQSHNWRFQRDSNPRSPAWQAGVLTATLLNQKIKLLFKYTRYRHYLSIPLSFLTREKSNDKQNPKIIKHKQIKPL